LAKPKKVVVLNGSPRLRGNTAVVLGWVEGALRRRGWQVQHHDLYFMDFSGCAHCEACKRARRAPICSKRDDLLAVLQGIPRASAIVVASPVYCWSVSGCTSAALDRFYCLFKGPGFLRGKRVAGVFTAGGDAFDGMDLCVSMLQRICEYGEADYAGTLAGVECDTPATTRKRTDLKRAAGRLAAEL
jgi:multimeric flavodoxin WrbA